MLAGLADKARDGKLAANWVINELFGRLNKEGRDITGSPVSAAQLGTIVDLIGEGTISGKIAKDLFEIVWQEGGDPRALVETRGMKQVTDLGAIEKVVDDIIAANPDKVAQAKAKPQLVGWFVGQVMKSSGGKANPKAVNDLPEGEARHLNASRNGTPSPLIDARKRASIAHREPKLRASRTEIDRHDGKRASESPLAIRPENRFWRAPMRREGCDHENIFIAKFCDSESARAGFEPSR